jgi:hypothetical protein
MKSRRYWILPLVWVVALCIGQLGKAVAQSQATYVLGGFQVNGVDPETLAVRYSSAWIGEDFPGWQACSLTLIDPVSGTVLEEPFELLDATPHPDVIELTIPAAPEVLFTNINVLTVAGECSGVRLDDPEGVYEFSNMSIQPDPQDDLPVDLVTYSVDYTFAWSGVGTIPGLNACTLTVRRGDTGPVLLEQMFTFDSGSPNGSEASRVYSPIPLVDEPNAYNVAAECVPFDATTAAFA